MDLKYDRIWWYRGRRILNFPASLNRIEKERGITKKKNSSASNSKKIYLL